MDTSYGSLVGCKFYFIKIENFENIFQLVVFQTVNDTIIISEQSLTNAAEFFKIE